MYRRTLIGLSLTALAVAAGPSAWIWRRNDGDISYDSAIRMLATARRETGLTALIPQPALTEAARRQTMHMARVERAYHLGPDAEPPTLRANLAGYDGRVLGEALAETFDGSADTMAFWLSHAPTRDVLMDAEATVFGLAVVQGRDGRNWWSMMTGAAPDQA